MTTLAQSTDVKDSGTFDPAEVTKALSFASSVIRGYCGQTLSAVTGDVTILTPVGYAVFLPQVPVTDVTRAEMKRVDADGVVSWVDIVAYDWLPNGMLYSTLRRPGFGVDAWPIDRLPGGVRVTYSHGFATIPDDLKDLCAFLAYLHLTNPRVRTQYTIGDKSESFAAVAEFSPYELAILDRYKARTVA